MPHSVHVGSKRIAGRSANAFTPGWTEGEVLAAVGGKNVSPLRRRRGNPPSYHLQEADEEKALDQIPHHNKNLLPIKQRGEQSQFDKEDLEKNLQLKSLYDQRLNDFP